MKTLGHLAKPERDNRLAFRWDVAEKLHGKQLMEDLLTGRAVVTPR